MPEIVVFGGVWGDSIFGSGRVSGAGASEQGEPGQRLLPQLLGQGSSAPPKVCQCDRLTVMIIYRWKSLAFVCFCCVPN